MKIENQQHYSLTELANISNLSPRTIRFYMSKDLVDKPLGARKTAYYTGKHLQQLLTVIDWQKEGLSLDDIRYKLLNPNPQKPPRYAPGDVQVVHRIHLGEGVDLNIDLQKTKLSQPQLRQLADHIYTWLENSRQSNSNDKTPIEESHHEHT